MKNIKLVWFERNELNEARKKSLEVTRETLKLGSTLKKLEMIQMAATQLIDLVS